jgi:branched-chain amino acid transport system ATP-binding protein
MLLEVESVSHWFGGLCAVNGLDLSLESGVLHGIIGPNGAGKTTVFNLITGVHRATQGNIRLLGEGLIGRTPHEITARGVARTFQNIRLFKDLSVLDNVRIARYGRTAYGALEALFHLGRYGREERRTAERAMELLALFRLQHLAAEPAKNLPYGQQRRLEIARALALEPKLLLLDEPAAGMNPNEIGELMDFVCWIREEFRLTILLIEHQMKLVMGVCERITVLDFGATIAEGTPGEIQKNPRVLEAYLGQEAAA